MQPDILNTQRSAELLSVVLTAVGAHAPPREVRVVVATWITAVTISEDMDDPAVKALLETPSAPASRAEQLTAVDELSARALGHTSALPDASAERYREVLRGLHALVRVMFEAFPKSKGPAVARRVGIRLGRRGSDA